MIRLDGGLEEGSGSPPVNPERTREDTGFEKQLKWRKGTWGLVRELACARACRQCQDHTQGLWLGLASQVVQKFLLGTKGDKTILCSVTSGDET